MSYKRLICPSHGVIKMADYEIPQTLGATQILVRHTHGAEKHGTMESFVHKHGNSRGAWDNVNHMHTTGEGVGWAYPIPLGNMQVGIVEKVGANVTRYKVGDRLVAFCGFCPYWLYNESEGWPIKEETNWKSATCLDPATFAFCALRDANVRIGDTVAVFSLGAIGMCAVALAKLAGCSKVIAIDPVASRREAALKIGADAVIDPTGIDCGLEIRKLTGMQGVDVVIEYSGSVHALNAAMRGVAFGGTVACGGFPAPYPAGLDFGGEAHMNRPNIVFTRTESDPNRDHPRWNNVRVRQACMELIIAGKINGDLIVGPIIKFSDDLDKVYPGLVADREGGIKLGVTY
jgi:threonine dehydrogenase-like Zn-dependent dehydrogenase